MQTPIKLLVQEARRITFEDPELADDPEGVAETAIQLAGERGHDLTESFCEDIRKEARFQKLTGAIADHFTVTAEQAEEIGRTLEGCVTGGGWPEWQGTKIRD